MTTSTPAALFPFTYELTDAPKGLLWAFRVVRPDFTSSHGFRWPYPGSWAEASGIPDARGSAFTTRQKRKFYAGDACPSVPGDGVCLAKTWSGAASGRIAANTILVCGYKKTDVLGEDGEKIRVSRAYVHDVADVAKVLARASGANLHGANLRGANLYGANLRGADLYGASVDSSTSPPADFIVRGNELIRA